MDDVIDVLIALGPPHIQMMCDLNSTVRSRSKMIWWRFNGDAEMRVIHNIS